MPERAREWLLPEVRALVDATLREATFNRTVAFDADGTLWRGDIGEDLLRYLATEDLLPNHRGRRGVYAEYERRVSGDPAAAYAWSVEVMFGMQEAHLEEICRDFFQQRFEGRLFPYVRTLLDQFREAGFEIHVVSASPIWPVLAGARALGIEADRVIAVECEVEQGRLAPPVKQPVPCGEGKVHGLKQNGVRPALAFGNGDLDLPMLAFAERAVVLAPPAGDNALIRAAAERGWPVQRC